MEIRELNALRGAEFSDALVTEVREELKRNKGSWKRLVELTNGRISYSWINAFARGRIRNVHVSTIAEVARYLGLQMRVARGPHFNRFEGD